MQVNNFLSQMPAHATAGAAHRYQTIEDVLGDPTLDVPQKRAILSSWASDLWAIESCPWLREVPGVKAPLRVSDIFAALRSLDDGPPRGGAAIRLFPANRQTTDARFRPGHRFAGARHGR